MAGMPCTGHAHAAALVRMSAASTHHTSSTAGQGILTATQRNVHAAECPVKHTHSTQVMVLTPAGGGYWRVA